MQNWIKVRVPVLHKDPQGKIKLYFVDVIMDIGLGFLLGSIFVNIGMQTFFGIDTAGWDSTTVLIWKAVPWAVIGAAITAFLRYARNPSTF